MLHHLRHEDSRSIQLRLANDWMGLNEHLFQLAELESAKDIRLTYFRKMAEIFEHKLNDQASAFVVYQAALRDDYANQDVAIEIDRLASNLKSYEHLINEYSNIPCLLEKLDMKAAYALKSLLIQWKSKLNTQKL